MLIDYSSHSYRVPQFKKVELTDLTKEQIGNELLWLAKLQLDNLPLNRPVTISILSLLYDRYKKFKQEQSVHVCFYDSIFEYLRHQYNRMSIRDYILSYEGIEGWEMAFDTLVEAAWLRHQLQKEKYSRF